MEGRLIIFSAPSGTGKSTIINYLLSHRLPLAFSVSATSRAPRKGEEDGVAYYFMSPAAFREKITAGAFVEYEEVYENTFYGTLKSEMQRIFATGRHVLFDIDVAGGCRLKKMYGNRALSIFLQPPSLDELRRRLETRRTDLPEIIEKRLEKAAYELRFASQFDAVVINDNLDAAQARTLHLVRQFIDRP
ncbi:MAG: guanylate kinase [Tannerella sp.]|jgi:guanylate kinase|nr:guanylate kinase [Tannerella sp.]